ncbi:hypothetical protein ACYF6T_36315 [Streptomyces sp. 7R007]
MTSAPGGYVDLAGSGPLAWCCTGVRLAPDPALVDNAAALGLPEERRRAQVVERERAWLAAGWAADGRCWELRYATPRAAGRDAGTGLSCVLLARAQGADRAGARGAARRLREELDALPRHVRAADLSGAELARALQPFTDGTAHLMEVRKRLRWERIGRSDAAFPLGVTVEPLTAQAVDWEPVWAELARAQAALVLAVRLEPLPWTPADHAHVERLLREYRTLALPGRFNPAIGHQAPAVPFAAHAAARYGELLAEAAVAPAHRMRVTLASDEPVPPRLAELVAATLSVPGPGRAVVCPVRAPHERQLAWRSFATLHGVALPGVRQQDVPVPLGPFEQALSERVPPAEATAAFRLPYEVPGHPPLFAPTPGQEPPAPRAQPPAPGPDLPPPPPGFTYGRTT